MPTRRVAFPRQRKDGRYRFEKGVRARLPADQWEVLKAEAGQTCFWCGRVSDGLEPDCRLEADHVVPIALGGTSDLWNFVAACRRCNRQKGLRSAREFLDDPTPEQLAKIDDVERQLKATAPPLG